MSSVGYAETAHAVSVSPLSEVALERLRALVRVVTADLARVADVQPVKFVQPVRDGLK